MARPLRLDYADAAELCAFLDSLGAARHGQWIFHWTPFRLAEAERLLVHMRQFDDHSRLVSENLAQPTREDGLAVLKAMQDGGWRHGAVPGFVRLALLDMRDAGISQPKIARATGLTLDQVRVMANGPRRPRAGFERLRVGDLVAGSLQ